MNQTSNIIIRLTQEDYRRIIEKCGSVQLPLEELVENFLKDLSGGRNINGSTESTLANQWFDQCWFSISAADEDSLMYYLNKTSYSIADVLRLVEEIQAKESMWPFVGEEDRDDFESDLSDLKEEYDEIVGPWRECHPDKDVKKRNRRYVPLV